MDKQTIQVIEQLPFYFPIFCVMAFTLLWTPSVQKWRSYV